MRTEVKTNVKNSVGRLIIVGIAALIQIWWMVSLFLWLNEYSALLNLLFSIGALLLVLYIYGKNSLAAFKMPWIILIMTFPLLGLVLYLLFGHKSVTQKMRRRFEGIDPKLLALICQDAKVIQELEKRDFAVANQCRYIHDYGKFPVYHNTDITFYAEASEGYEAQLAALAQAKRFIFMEYHAIQEAESFARLKRVLAERVQQGVEVRILYDDVGSIGFIDPGFIKRMEAIGVQCRVFNPVMPIFNLFMNNRDHRKITVIDGEIGFTGGYNLADEYFNISHPYGYWKDTGIKLVGEAVESLTVMFLEMWNAMKETDVSYEKYFVKPVQSVEESLRADRECAAEFLQSVDACDVSASSQEDNLGTAVKSSQIAKESGFIQLYADSPLDGEPLGENVYLNLIKSAKHRLYITTPYLIISDEMNRELTLAAKRGVDVRVITPGIPDKKLIYKVTRSYYAGLVQGGVRIYEYTPGFLHAKQVLCDDKTAVVGTINFDYRSLYHHFENAAFLYDCGAVGDIAEDFKRTLETSEEVTERYEQYRNRALKIGQSLLRLFAPLL